MSDTNKKLFVGRLAWATTEDSLREFFMQAGTVETAQVIMDKMSGRSKGFGFVEMATPEEAQAAIQMLDGKELDGRNIAVTIARPREEFPRRGGDRGGFRPRGGSRGGFGGGDRGGYNSDDSF